MFLGVSKGISSSLLICKSWTSHTFLYFVILLNLPWNSNSQYHNYLRLDYFSTIYTSKHWKMTWTYQGQPDENNFLTLFNFRFDRLKSHKNHQNSLKFHQYWTITNFQKQTFVGTIRKNHQITKCILSECWQAIFGQIAHFWIKRPWKERLKKGQFPTKNVFIIILWISVTWLCLFNGISAM